MVFDKKDPLALKIVYSINIFFVISLVFSGFLLAIVYWLPLLVFALAFFYYKVFASALIQKKRYSYYLNLMFHVFGIISIFIATIKNGFNYSSLELALQIFFRLLNAVAIYFLLSKEMRVIFLPKRSVKPKRR
ncbi:MAG TPA: hypothetical protein VJA18_04710 [Candidatus Nanoarchaeia archaeon]|nr:hypothetical protein [Candidatus Nanoarchaeia archaeon]